MNIMLAAESLTSAQIQTLFEKDNRRKAQCVAACIRWAAKNKENGTFSEKRSEYNKRHREKRLGKKDMGDFPFGPEPEPNIDNIEPNIEPPKKV